MARTTHETFINKVAAIAIARLDREGRKRLGGIKLVYGAGEAGLRGVTYFDRWQNGGDHPTSFVEVTAFGEEGWIQLAGTTIHELAHVLAGSTAGHSHAWGEACAALGLRHARAAGHVYTLAGFAPELRQAIAGLDKPDDGTPVKSFGSLFGTRLRPCGAGVGTRGGRSRGAGSGSRMRLFECECQPPVKVRAARDELKWTCDECGANCHRV